MTRSLLAGLLAALAASVSYASDPPPGSLDTWVEACDATDSDLQALLANEAFIVHFEGIEQHHDGTFSLYHQFFEETAGGEPLCPQSLFYGQTQVQATPFRSAVQVGPDLVLTAWHGPFDPHAIGDYVVVFGLQYRETGDTCLPPAFEHIPADRLYGIAEVFADGAPGSTSGIDFLALRLDREIGGLYPRLRRSGRGLPGDSVTVIGHPERLAAKVDLAGVAGEITTLEGRELLEVANVHLRASSSGSMLYNRTQRFLETVVTGGGAAAYFPAGSAEPDCKVLGHVDGWSALGASLRHFAENIPAFELVVDDLDPVVNATTVGGVLPNPSTSRTVQAPTTAAGPLAYEIVPPPPFEPGQPTLIITPGAPSSGTLAPGSGFTIQEQAHIHGVGCGRYERSYEVRDLTNGFQDVARHVFEIGLRGFTVSPQRPELIEDVAAPYENTRVYLVANPRLDPVTVIVSANHDWITLNGTSSPGLPPSIELQLQPGEVVPVTFGIASFLAPARIPQEFDTVVTFDFAPGTVCPAFAEPVTRDFNFVIGRESFGGEAGPIPNGSPHDFTASVPETFCVGDLDVEVHVKDAPANQILATMTAPTPFPIPTQRTLWNQGSLPAPKAPLGGILDDEANGAGELLPFQSLSAFDNAGGGGLWHFNVVDNVIDDPAVLTGWSLRFTAKACP